MTGNKFSGLDFLIQRSQWLCLVLHCWMPGVENCSTPTSENELKLKSLAGGRSREWLAQAWTLTNWLSLPSDSSKRSPQTMKVQCYRTQNLKVWRRKLCLGWKGFEEPSDQDSHEPWSRESWSREEGGKIQGAAKTKGRGGKVASWSKGNQYILDKSYQEGCWWRWWGKGMVTLLHINFLCILQFC